METHALHLIGLTGLAGSGKDSVRGVLQQHGYTGIAFADPIRDMVRALFIATGTGMQWMDDRALKEQTIPHLGVSYRQLAQTLGTEWGRSLAPDFWLTIATATIDAMAGHTFGPLQIVISDVRFPNEAEWVRQRGGQIWHVVRPGTQPVRAHASEAHALAIPSDYTILNDGTLQDLERTVQQALLWADSHEAAEGADVTDEHLCTCEGLDFPSLSELQRGKCDTCGKAVVL